MNHLRSFAPAFAVATLFLLTACTSGEETETVLGLETTPSVSSMKWELDTKKLPDGFTVEPSGREGSPTEGWYAQDPSGACSIQYGIEFQGSNQLGKTDDFLTRDYLFGAMERSSAVDKSQITSQNISAGEAEAEFLFASHTVEEENNPAVNFRSVARVFDTLQPNGFNPEALIKEMEAAGEDYDPEAYSETHPDGSDATKGLPTAVITYQCVGEEISDANWDKALEAANLVGVTKK